MSPITHLTDVKRHFDDTYIIDRPNDPFIPMSEWPTWTKKNNRWNCDSGNLRRVYYIYLYLYISQITPVIIVILRKNLPKTNAPWWLHITHTLNTHHVSPITLWLRKISYDGNEIFSFCPSGWENEWASERTGEMEDAVNHQILLTMKNIPSSGSEPVLTTEVWGGYQHQ